MNELAIYQGISSEITTYLQESETYILERCALMYDAIVQVGQKLVEVRETIESRTFTSWIEQQMPFTYATALNYMHVAENMSDVPSAAAMNIKARALYLLSAPDVPEDVRQAAISYAGQMTVDYDLACILVNAPDYLKKLYQDGKVSTQDAADVSRLYKSAFGDVQSVCMLSKVADPDVVRFLITLYTRHCRDGQPDDSAWTDVTHNGGLQYGDDFVPLSEATCHACQSYLDFRGFEQRVGKREVVFEGKTRSVSGRVEVKLDGYSEPNEELYITIWRLLK